MLTPIVNRVLERLRGSTYSAESLEHTVVTVVKDSLRGMSEFMLVGSLIPASVMTGSIKAFCEMSLNLEEHCEQLFGASIAGATSVNVSLADAVYGSSFQLLSNVSKHSVPSVSSRLQQFIEQHPDWSEKDKEAVQTSLSRAIAGVSVAFGDQDT